MLLSKALSLKQPASSSPPIYTYAVVPSPADANATIICPSGYPPYSDVSYSIIASPNKKPNITVFRGDPAARQLIGHATFHSLSSTTDLTLNGQSLRMKQSQLSGTSYSIHCTQFGNLKWKSSEWGGSALGLYDSAGTKLAQLKSTGAFGSKEKKLEILVPCDGFLVDLVVISAMGLLSLKKKVDKNAAKLIEAVAGG
ncbi:hypothetical protein EJ08DRAFT_639709 [Tothia fuscella]|uniref:Uncharacterized protein n=1 Tax=Tothia fuscella TaxID=1048955 RepID=A0A9P4NJH3_9PEZI|nr:hypothetical protein EJ08DRAFT_639709 [Tothia fuscella]